MKIQGVFKKSDGILKVWYSDDSKRLPIKISSKVVIGSFTAKLENFKKKINQKPVLIRFTFHKGNK